MNLAGVIKLTFGEVSALDKDVDRRSASDTRSTEGKRSHFRGVRWDGNMGKWRAELRNNGRSLELGHYSNEVVAAWIYDAAALRVHGSSAKLNFPDISDP